MNKPLDMNLMKGIDDADVEIIPKQIAFLRKLHGLSQAELVKLVGCTGKQISNY